MDNQIDEVLKSANLCNDVGDSTGEDGSRPRSLVGWVAWAIIALITAFLFWDLLPLFEIKQRQARLREIAVPGAKWADVKRQLDAEGFLIPASGTTLPYKLVYVQRRDSLLQWILITTIYKIDRRTASKILGIKAAKFAGVILDKSDTVQRVESGNKIII